MSEITQMFPHDFIAGNTNAQYPYLCRKCGMGLDKYCISYKSDAHEPCIYPDPVTSGNH